VTEQSAADLWAEVSGRLRADLPVGVFAAWFGAARPVGLAGDDLEIGVPNEFTRAWIEGHFSDLVSQAAAESRERLGVHFAVVGDDGEPLDWYAFVVDSRTSLRSPTGARPSPTTVTTTAIPAPVSYPGMPAERFWQFEDASVDLGGVDAAPIDLARLLLLEFVTVYGNDWHVVPVGPIAAGSLVRLRSLTVTTSFGESVAVHPFSTNAAVARAWRMFELEPLAVPGGPTPATADLLFVPPSLASRLESTPLEEVDFVRDEVAALVWGIERTVPDVTERPFDRFSAYQARREQQRQGPSSPPIAPLAPLSYRLHTDVPDFWIPFVPTNKDGTRRLVQTPMAGVNALGRTMGSPALELYDEEVPRSGTRLTRVYRYARWIDGSTHVWLARRRSVGGTGSSGLRFDSVDPAP